MAERSKIRFHEDGSLTVEGLAPLIDILTALCNELGKFLARMESSERTGDQRHVVSADGARVLWENITLLAATALAHQVPALTPEENTQFERDGVFFHKGDVRFPRRFLPLRDVLHQLTLLILRDRNGAWRREVSVEAIERARSVHAELRLHLDAPPGRKTIERRSVESSPRKGAWVPRAILFVKKDPHRTDAEIARLVGVARSTVKRSEEFQLAARLARHARGRIRRGHRVADAETGQRDVEAIDDQDDELDG